MLVGGHVKEVLRRIRLSLFAGHGHVVEQVKRLEQAGDLVVVHAPFALVHELLSQLLLDAQRLLHFVVQTLLELVALFLEDGARREEPFVHSRRLHVLISELLNRSI